jgi:F5/8 type C domain-containing protein
MNSNASAPRRRTRATVLTLGLASAVLSCAVYDESLRQGSSAGATAGSPDGGHSSADGGRSSADGGHSSVDGGRSNASAGARNPGGGGHTSAGGAGTSMAGATTHGGAPNTGGYSGEPKAGASNVGGAGSASGGSGGIEASAGNAGTLPSAGSSSYAGTAGVPGSVSELAVGKPSSAFTQQSANPSSSGNDGQTATRWSASTAALPQWWRVDLGASHVLTKVSVQFEFPDRKYTYAVETSADDSSYTAQANVTDGTGAVQVIAMPSLVSARYVRITCTGTVPGVDPSTGASRPTWMSFWELSVLGY